MATAGSIQGQSCITEHVQQEYQKHLLQKPTGIKNQT